MPAFVDAHSRSRPAARRPLEPRDSSQILSITIAIGFRSHRQISRLGFQSELSKENAPGKSRVQLMLGISNSILFSNARPFSLSF
jgi:hypothetical protein